MNKVNLKYGLDLAVGEDNQAEISFKDGKIISIKHSSKDEMADIWHESSKPIIYAHIGNIEEVTKLIIKNYRRK